jgi:hypothetical protein
MTELHEYTEEFFDYIERGSITSAKRFSALIVPLLKIKSLLDVGCGRGAWLREWVNAGVEIAQGVDGPYVRRESLLIPPQDFTAVDLSKKFNLGRRYSLVSSLEVGEHLPRSASEGFVSSLVAHSDLILFSAATPGQGGENHINEQPLCFWQRAFATHGYVAFDAIRPKFRRDPLVEPWYRSLPGTTPFPSCTILPPRTARSARTPATAVRPSRPVARSNHVRLDLCNIGDLSIAQSVQVQFNFVRKSGHNTLPS